MASITLPIGERNVKKRKQKINPTVVMASIIIAGFFTLIVWIITEFSSENKHEPGLVVTGQVDVPESVTNIGNEESVKTLHKMINDVRKERHLAPLKLSDVLNSAADRYAMLMASENTLSHDFNGHGDPGKRIKGFGYKWVWCAENIAFNQRTLNRVMESWMNSEGHRMNILSPKAEEIGIGIMLSRKQEPYYCTIFAKPAKGE